MEPTGQEQAGSEFGPGDWRIVALAGLPGVEPGQVIRVVRSDRWWIFLKPGAGQLARAEVAHTAVDTSGSEVLLTNREDGLSLRLAPASRQDGATELLAWDGDELLPWDGDEPPATLTRVYRGKPEAAARLMREDAARLEHHGYVATSQNYAEGQWGFGAWVFAFFALVLLVGIIILAYMIASHPEGTLTVVYERRLPVEGRPTAAVQPTSQGPAAAAASVLTNQLADLETARQAGLVTEEEYAAKRSEILARF